MIPLKLQDEEFCKIILGLGVFVLSDTTEYQESFKRNQNCNSFWTHWPNSISFFLLVLNTFSHFHARQRSEGGREGENGLIEHSPYENGWKCQSPLSSLVPLLLLGAPKKKGEKEIVGIVWIEYSAGIGARRRTVLLLARVEFWSYLLHSKREHNVLGPK